MLSMPRSRNSRQPAPSSSLSICRRKIFSTSFTITGSRGAAARLSSIPEADRAAIDPGFLEIARAGAAYSSTELALAQVRRGEYGAAMDLLLADYDFLVSPATALPAFEAGLEVPAASAYGRWTEWAGFAFPINLSQQPACVIPCGFTAAGLPVGFQIIGARGDDARVLSAAASLEVIFAR